jgi:alcohol dehydrogenase
MKAAQLKKYGGREAVSMADISKPAVSEGKVLIEVHAAGINPFDWKVRAGYMKDFIRLTFPSTPGGDFSGVALEVGPGVSGIKRGDPLFGQAYVFGGGSGAFAEFVLADTKQVAPKPKKFGQIEAGALPEVGVSALQALTEHLRLQKGQKILIHGGAGGIGSMAIQLAKHLGASVATTVSGKNISYVKQLGADQIVDYKKDKFEDQLKDYDAVFDTVGGETYTRSFKVLKRGGIIVSMLEEPNQELMKQYGVAAVFQSTQVTADRLAKLAKFVDQDVIKVHVEKTFPLDQAAEALSYLEENHPRGKVVLGIKE